MGRPITIHRGGATASPEAPPPISGPVSVNGVVIAESAIGQETQNHPASSPAEAWQLAAHALVVRELLLQEAMRLDIRPAPATDPDGRRETEEEALIGALIASEVRTPSADEATCRRHYQQNRRRFRTPDLHELRHILLPAAPLDQAARAEARRQAASIIEQIQGDPDAFAALATAMSACPSAATGGSLGQIGRGQTVPEFEGALATLPVGEVAAQPVESRYGLHVVWLDRRIVGRELPFEAVQARIAAWLDEAVRRTAIRQYLSILAGRATITGIEIEASATPLAQ
jgi:peptidyl-prolyl cis-trans isomerase C